VGLYQCVYQPVAIALTMHNNDVLDSNVSYLSKHYVQSSLFSFSFLFCYLFHYLIPLLFDSLIINVNVELFDKSSIALSCTGFMYAFVCSFGCIHRAHSRLGSPTDGVKSSVGFDASFCTNFSQLLQLWSSVPTRMYRTPIPQSSSPNIDWTVPSLRQWKHRLHCHCSCRRLTLLLQQYPVWNKSHP
jgi:hypothetical protein